MSLSFQPEIFGTIQPDPATPTVVVLTPPNRPGQVNLFITNNENYLDRVRVQLRPDGEPVLDEQFILYDTPIIAGHTVTISMIHINAADEIIAYTESGACTFTVSGTAFVYA